MATERLYMDSTKFYTKDSGGNKKFSTEKTYVKTDDAGAVKISLLKKGFAITNPIVRDGSSLPWASGMVAGFPFAQIKLDRPDSQGTFTLPGFPVNGYFLFKWCRCSTTDDVEHETNQYFTKQFGYRSWIIKRGTSEVGSIYSSYGYFSVSSGKSSTNYPVIYGSGSELNSGVVTGSDVTVSVSAFERLVMVPDKNCSQFTYTQYQGKGLPYANVRYGNIPSTMLIQFIAYDKDLPLSFTV